MPDEKISVGKKLFDSLQQLNEGDSSVLVVLRVRDKQTVTLVKEVDAEELQKVCEGILADYNEMVI